MIGPVDTEARFSAPSAWCPDPHWWHSTDDHSTEIEVSEMIAGFARALQPSLVVETGAAWGQTAEAVGRALLENGHGRCVSIEPDPERAAYARQRCSGLPVDIAEMSSMDYSPPGMIGLAFFDSLFPLRVPEFERYRPSMMSGAVIVFHDTAPLHGGGQLGEYPDLKEQVEQMLPGVPLLHLRTPRGVTIGQVW